MTQGNVTVAGAVIADTVVRPVDQDRWGATAFVESITRCVGGNAANTSLALAKLGVTARVLGAVGNDAEGDFLRSQLAGAGVDVSGLQAVDEPTAQTIVLVNSEGNRKFLHRMGAGAAAFREPVAFEDAGGARRHFHLASLFIVPHLRTSGAALLAAARSAGWTTSFDTNWDPKGRWMQDVAPLLPHLDYLFMNEDESRMVTGFDDAAPAAEVVLRHGVGHAVMKLSNRGCAVFSTSEEIHEPAFPVQPIDSTGAGDCFVAGFLASLLRGGSLREAARFANAVGALNVQAVGAVTAMRPYREVVEWMAARVPGGSGTASPAA